MAEPLHITRFAGLALASLLALSACGPRYDPLTREGLWQPTHANRSNLTMMVANPADLVRGSAAPGTDAQMAAAAVERWRNDKIKPLPSADVAQISSGSNNGQSGSGGGGGGGAGGAQ